MATATFDDILAAQRETNTLLGKQRSPLDGRTRAGKALLDAQRETTQALEDIEININVGDRDDEIGDDPEKKNKDPKSVQEEIENSNIIKDVEYRSKDSSGNEYTLKSSEGIIDQNNTNIIYLTSIKAIIELEGYNSIDISSKFGKYSIDNFSNNWFASTL